MSRASAKSTVWHRLYHGETSYDFVGRKRLWFLASGAVIAIGVISLLTQGLNYGIDFKGGLSWEVKAPNVSVAKARSTLRPFGLGEAKVQIAGGDNLRVEFKHLDQAKQKQVTEALSKLAGGRQVSVNDVGPSWGKTVTNKARTALVAFFIAITIYISFRFEWKMAIAAIVAVIHDILVTVGVYSVSRFEVTPATVVAFLTILGYSLYDTVVVYDKVQENTRGLSASGRMTYGDTVNLSMNQVLMRSINTSLVAILPIFSVLVVGAYVLGATTLKDFGLALLVGLLTGAYSSIFIASPILAVLKEREPRYASIRARVLAKGGAGVPLTPAAAALAQGGLAGSAAGGRASTGGSEVLRPGSGRAGATVAEVADPATATVAGGSDGEPDPGTPDPATPPAAALGARGRTAGGGSG
ncbi:MAG: protein translocase subunit SecF, partial [Acidimicrobiales bacterium]